MVLKYIFARLYIVASLIAIAVFAMRGCMDEKEVVHDIKQITVQRTDSLKHYKDLANREHGYRVLSEANSAVIGTVYRQEVDSLVDALGIKEKQLQTFTMVGTERKGTVALKVDQPVIDSVYDFTYQDKWLDLSGKVTGKVGGQSQLNYRITDSLIFSTYWKRKWLLGRKTTYIDAYSLNPAVHITGLDAAKISVREPGRFSIGPYIGYGYSGQRWQPSIGFSLQYSLIRF